MYVAKVERVAASREKLGAPLGTLHYIQALELTERTDLESLELAQKIGLEAGLMAFLVVCEALEKA
jgi:hypothetical protein